jgi:hypothetical protein
MREYARMPAAKDQSRLSGTSVSRTRSSGSWCCTESAHSLIRIRKRTSAGCARCQSYRILCDARLTHWWHSSPSYGELSSSAVLRQVSARGPPIADGDVSQRVERARQGRTGHAHWIRSHARHPWHCARRQTCRSKGGRDGTAAGWSPARCDAFSVCHCTSKDGRTWCS